MNEFDVDKEIVSLLLETGYKLIKDTDYFYINIEGKIFNAKTGTFWKGYTTKNGSKMITFDRHNEVTQNSKVIASLVLDHFGNGLEWKRQNNKFASIPIMYFDNNKNNTHLSNLKYCSFAELFKSYRKQGIR